MVIALDARITCPPDVVSRILDGEAVLLHLGSGLYFGANEVASRAWERIVEGASFGEVLATLVDEFEVSEETARADLEEFVHALEAQRLVVLDGQSKSTVATPER